MSNLVLSNNTAASQHAVTSFNISSSTEILPQNLTRRSALVQCSAPVIVAGGAVAELFIWTNKAALSVAPVAGTVDVSVNEDYD